MATGAHTTATTQGGWPASWVISLAAAVIAAVLGRWIGDTSMTAAVLVGVMVFLVFGVLLGMFWTEPPMASEHGHDHAHHDHHPAPVVAPLVQSQAEVKPVGLAGPRGGVADPLQTIEGLGPVLETMCHELGIYHFDQIAGWGPGEIAWMDSNLKGFKGRVSRDKWVRQARLIGEIGLDAFKIRAAANDY